MNLQTHTAISLPFSPQTRARTTLLPRMRLYAHLWTVSVRLRVGMCACSYVCVSMCVTDGTVHPSCCSHHCTIPPQLTSGQWAASWGVLGREELLGRRPLFPAQDYLAQIGLLVTALGVSTKDDLGFICNSNARSFVRGLSGTQVRYTCVHFALHTWPVHCSGELDMCALRDGLR